MTTGFNTAPVGAPMGTYQYNGMPNNAVTKFVNPLTAEQIKRLQAKEAQFSLGLTEEEQLRAICNHRNAEGTGDTLVYDPVTGEARCTICGYTFRPIEPGVGPDVLKEDVDRIVDILQTIKLMYVDLPAEVATEYFQIIPLIEKIPQLFEFAAKNMNKHDVNMWNYNNQNMGSFAMFNNLANMFGNMGNMMPNYSAQQFTQPQPMMTAGYPQANAFGFAGASQQPGYFPGTDPNFAFQAGQQAAPQVAPTNIPTAPAAPVADATVTQTVSI